MRTAIHVMTTVLIVLISVQSVAAQTSSDIWRSFAERVDVGTELNVRLNDGRRFRATLVAVRTDAMLLQPKTRVPVAIQAVPYEQGRPSRTDQAGHRRREGRRDRRRHRRRRVLRYSRAAVRGGGRLNGRE